MRLFLLFALFIASCSWYVIGYQNQTALNLANQLYADVHSVVVAKSAGAQFDPAAYGRIEADISNCVAVYNSIPKSDLSISQLKILSHSIATFRSQDSAGAGRSFFQQVGPLVDSTASAVRELEIAKIKED